MIDIDRESLIALARGATPVAEVERRLVKEGLTLGLSVPTDASVADWLAEGAPGAAAPWDDPADHLVAGFSAHFPDGRLLEVRPAPRRSVGPDLFALVLGQRHRYVRVVEAWLRVHPIAGRRPRAPFVAPVAPEPNDGERALMDVIARELAHLPET